MNERRKSARLLLGATIGVAAVLALSACTSGLQNISVAPSQWVTTTPPASGRLDSVKWNLPYGEPTTLDWIHAGAFSENGVLANLCESLIRLGKDYRYEPGLAEKWSSPNPTTWVYDLRPGLRFSDGKPLTTEDVVYSLNRSRQPKLGSFWEPWFENIKSIRATGKRQVTIELSKPESVFNEFLATAGGVVAEKSYLEKQGEKFGTAEGGVMCVGPYELSEWTPGKRIRIVANPDYWDKAHAPKVGEVEFQFLTNGQTASDALSSGELDGSYETPLSAWAQLPKLDVGHAYNGKSLSFVSVEFTEKEGPGRDLAFRRALSFALDREAIAKTIYHGAAAPIRSPFFPTTWGYARDVYRRGYESLPDTEQDLARARALVAKVPDLRTVSMISNAEDVAARQLAAYIQSQAAEIGISIKLVELPPAQFIAAAFDPKIRNQYDMSVGGTSYLDIPEPVEWGEIALRKNGVFNTFGYANSEVDRWVREARLSLDPRRRAALMVKAERQAFGRDVTAISVVNTAERLFMGDDLTGAAAALTPYLYYPWARDLGASE